MTNTTTLTDTITLLLSEKPIVKGVFIGGDGDPKVGKVKMGLLFDVSDPRHRQRCCNQSTFAGHSRWDV